MAGELMTSITEISAKGTVGHRTMDTRRPVSLGIGSFGGDSVDQSFYDLFFAPQMIYDIANAFHDGNNDVLRSMVSLSPLANDDRFIEFCSLHIKGELQLRVGCLTTHKKHNWWLLLNQSDPSGNLYVSLM
jgi:hypothetical protein